MALRQSTRRLLVALLLLVAGAFLLQGGAYFAWLTAGPAVGTPTGVRSMTPAELALARSRANLWLTASVACFLASIGFGVAFLKSRRKERAS